MASKNDLSDYLTRVSKIKPSAEIKFRTTDDNGVVTEEVASRTYVSNHISDESDLVDSIPGLRERLNRVTEEAAKDVGSESIEDLDAEVEEEALEESADVSFRDARQPEEEEESPLTYAPNASTEPKTTQELSETAMLIKLVSQLIDRIDQMQNFNPVIHVPAPVIHVTMPETKKTVTRAVERDDEGFIKSIREHVEEAPEGEPLIEVQQEKPKRKRREKKDNE
jgi:hypothetical protein